MEPGQSHVPEGKRYRTARSSHQGGGKRRPSHRVEADELAGLELVEGLAGVRQRRVDGDAGVDDDGAVLNAEDGALDAAGAAVDGFDVLAAGADGVDAFGLKLDDAEDALADGRRDGHGGDEVQLVAGIGDGEDDVGGLGGGGGDVGVEDAAGKAGVDFGGRGGGDHLELGTRNSERGIGEGDSGDNR